jgi:hypothetical protein
MTASFFKIKEGFLPRIFGSNFLLLALYVLAFDLILSAVIPLANNDWFLRSYSCSDELFCSKVLRYILGTNDPDVVFLGSSVVAVPALSCDRVLVQHEQPFKKLPHMCLYSQYPGCDYFAKLLSRKWDGKVSVVNMGLAGSVASDYPAILQKSRAFGKKPLLIVCGISPQEFFWNDSRGADKTHVRNAFNSYPWPPCAGNLALTADALWREPRWHLTMLQNELSLVRQDLTWTLSQATGRVPAAQSVVIQKTPCEAPAAVTAAHGSAAPGKNIPIHDSQFADLAQYRAEYATINRPLFDQHVRNFEQMLSDERAKNQWFVVVNMPLTTENKNVLSREAIDLYRKNVLDSCARHGIPLLDVDAAGQFQEADFYDSAHLNQVGGAKFFKLLADELAHKKMLCELGKAYL